MADTKTTCGGCISSATAKSGWHSCDTYTPAVILTPGEALTYGRRAASSAVRKYGIAASDAADDVLSAALLIIAESGKDLTQRRLAATIGIVAMTYSRGRSGDTYNRTGAQRADTMLPVSLDRETGEDGGTLADIIADKTAGSDDRDGARILTRAMPDGSTLTVTTDRWGADVESAVLRNAATGSLAVGRDALEAAQAMLLSVSRGSRHGAAVQAVRALTRDGAILATAGMPWAEALATLAEQGIELSRVAYRVGLMRARQRQDC